jgi:hypothetical protein
MAALNAKTFLADMLENDDFREYTFPEVFGGDTPDFALIQSCGKKIANDSSDNVGRNSVRKSNGYVVGNDTCCVGNVMDATNAFTAHSSTYSYWNMGAPVSDEGDGVRTSRGTVTMIPNGVRVTNDSAYTTENHQLAISLVGGTDIGNAALVKYDSSIGTGLGGGQELILPFKGMNLSMVMAAGGPADTEHVGFNDSQGIAFCKEDTVSFRQMVNGGYIASARYNAKTDVEELWATNTEQFVGSLNGAAWCCAAISDYPLPNIGDAQQNTKVRHGSIQETIGDASTDTLTIQLTTNGNNSLTGLDGYTNEVHVYMIALNFNHVTQDNLTFFAHTAGNPFTDNNQWDGPSTRGTAELNDPYRIGGTDSDNWPNTTSSAMSSKPTTFGMFLMNAGQASNSVGIASNNFQYDGRVGEFNEDAGKSSYGHGIGYCIDTTGKVLYGGGYPDTFVYTKPDFDMIIPYYNAATGDLWVGQADALYPGHRKVGGEVSGDDPQGGSKLVELRHPTSTAPRGAYCTVVWDDEGYITNVTLSLTEDAVGYTQNEEYVLTFGDTDFTLFSVYVVMMSVDGINYEDSEGRTNVTRDISWGTDGSIELTQEGPSPWSYGQDAWEGHIIMASSDNAGSGVSGGGGGDFTIFYGTIPVSAVYLGDIELSAIAYGDIQV